MERQKNQNRQNILRKKIKWQESIYSSLRLFFFLVQSLGFFKINYLFIYLFIYFWLHWVFVAACRLSLVEVSGGYSSLWCVGFSLQWFLLLRSTGSRHTGFSSCGTWAQQLWLAGSRVQAQQLWRTGLVAPRHVGSPWTRARTRVLCIGRQILNHCATREARFETYYIATIIKTVWYQWREKHIDQWNRVKNAETDP